MSADADASPVRNAFGEFWRDLAHVGLSLAKSTADIGKNLDFDFFRFPEKIYIFDFEFGNRPSLHLTIVILDCSS